MSPWGGGGGQVSMLGGPPTLLNIVYIQGAHYDMS